MSRWNEEDELLIIKGNIFPRQFSFYRHNMTFKVKTRARIVPTFKDAAPSSPLHAVISRHFVSLDFHFSMH